MKVNESTWTTSSTLLTIGVVLKFITAMTYMPAIVQWIEGNHISDQSMVPVLLYMTLSAIMIVYTISYLLSGQF